MATALAPRPQLNLGSLSEPAELGRMLASSGYFSDARDAAQAVVKVLAGMELGIPPIAAMTGVFIVKGRVTLGANLIAALIKRHPRYDLRVKELTNEKCEIAFLQDGEEIGTSSFTIEDARKAGIANGENWRNYPRNMLFARAVSNGAKWYVPDVFAGAPVYTPDELGAETDPETGDLIPVETGTIVNGQLVDSETGELAAKAAADEAAFNKAAREAAAPEPGGAPEPTSSSDSPEAPASPPEPPELKQSVSQAKLAAAADRAQTAADVELTSRAAMADTAHTAVGEQEQISEAEHTKLLEVLDALEAPESFRRMAAMAAGVEDLSGLTRAQARDTAEKARARFGS